MQRSLTILLAVCAGILVVIGRIETIHMTEGEALISGAVYWASAIFLVGLSFILSRKSLE